MNTVLPVEVQCKSLPNREELFLRATPLFSLPQYEHELVQRCTVHQQQNQNLPKNDNVEPHILKHVLRCSNHGSMYMGNVDTNDHLNVRTPLPQPQAGIDTVRINYEFMCKNSCPSGMNRRATDIIFTLENAYGEVLGRRKLGVRVCSCPKRDKEKEEQEFKEAQKQNSTQNNNGVPMRKKRKLGKKPSDNELANGERKNLDNSLVTIPGIEVLGRDIALDTLRFVQDRMIAEMHHGRFNGNETQAKECIKNLESLMSK